MIFGHEPYEWFKDQGSLISGLLALAAGGLAYAAGRRQALAAEAQSDSLRQANRRHVLREGLSTVRIMTAVLLDHRAAARAFDYARPGITFNIPVVVMHVPSLPLLEVQETLGRLDRIFMGDYCDLRRRVEDFRSLTQSTAQATLDTRRANIVLAEDVLIQDLERRAADIIGELTSLTAGR